MSSPNEGRSDASRDRVAGAVEREIEVLRTLRPALEARIDRAATILVTHLSSPGGRVMRVRIGSHRRPAFLVRSANGSGVYVVDPSTWECSCPDWRRRSSGGACKHGIACYVLWKAGKGLAAGCPACTGGCVEAGGKPEDGDEARGRRVPCQRCGGRGRG